ncbi:hypothetical protein AA106555_0540 [Neokomagataea thailandica NBRC 106555]|uniref:Transposase n=1 Tax=Neokomagataea thailandica NBRC 106555 TaxID=1223520 RepID=A0ABQ0QND7_9PROT|nr:hypothetical protein AA106555_0540 [Neokomagataea thailandica NBRC 106555]
MRLRQAQALLVQLRQELLVQEQQVLLTDQLEPSQVLRSGKHPEHS